MVQRCSDQRTTCKSRILTKFRISFEVSLFFLLPREVMLNSSSGTYLEAQSSLRCGMPQNEVLSLQYKAGSLTCGPVHQLL